MSAYTIKKLGKIALIIIVLLGGLVFALKTFYPKQWNGIVNAPGNYVDAMNVKYKNIDLKIKTKILFKIENEIDEALKTKQFDRIKSYYEGKMFKDGQKFDIQFRLKGDQYDHYNTQKYSLRIKAYQLDTLKEVFSIQNPKTRNYLNEYVFHQLLKNEGLNYLNYDFVGGTINGVFNGIYAYEEHFSNPSLTAKWNKNGFVVGFNDDEFWTKGEPSERNRAYDTERFLEADLKIYADSSSYTHEVSQKINAFREQNLDPSVLFDLKMLGKFYAICDLSGARHALRWINVRYLYNIESELLEPVGFDSNSGKLIKLMKEEDYINPILHGKILSHPIFIEAYDAELKRVANQEYLDSFFVSIQNELAHNLKLIHKDQPAYQFNKALWYDNSVAIQGFLK